MKPIISVVGRSNTGKTTFLEKLIRELKARGYRVATIKHHLHPFEVDTPGKDSWRHAQAGADTTVVASPAQMALMRRLPAELSLDQLAEMIGDDVDIILTEGYKFGTKPKIEISRQERGTELLCTADELVALVTDVPRPGFAAPQFGLDDAAGVADLLEARFLRR